MPLLMIQSAHFGASLCPQGWIGTVEVELFCRALDPLVAIDPIDKNIAFHIAAAHDLHALE
jgi:hypothetical protein